MWLHSMSDMSWSSLLLMLFTSLSSPSFSLLIHHSHFTSYFFSYHDPSRVWYSLHITIIHLIISLICFICLLVDTMFTLGTVGSMAHEDFLYMLHFVHEGMGFDHWVFELSFPSFLSPYHPSLRYVPCLKTTLRPWNRISSSTASMWTGVWDSVDI